MDVFTQQKLKELVEVEEPTISIYMPTLRSGREVQQNAIRFKNVVRQANEQLEEHFPDNRALKAKLDEIAHWQSNDVFWQHQSDGLAIFLTADRVESYRVPLEFEELVTVNDRFYLRPMVNLLQGDGRFYLLAVSQNHVRFLEGTRYSVDEITLDDLPTDLRSALNIDEYVDSRQHHTAGDRGVAGDTIFHSQGSADLDVHKKDEIRQYFHRLSDPLEDYLDDQRKPLVFCGVQYLFPLFRECCRYKALMEEAVRGNPDELKAEQLHQRAWKIVQPHFDRERFAALEQFHNSSDTAKVMDDLRDIIQAARQGAVDTLLVSDDHEIWGTVNEELGAVVITDDEPNGTEELLNYAALQTLTKDGIVYSLPQEKLPNEHPAIALLRYPARPTRGS